MNKSIRYLFFTAVAAILVSGMLVLGLLETYMATTRFSNEQQDRLERAVAVVSQGVAQDEVNTVPDELESVVKMAEITGATIFFVNKQGMVFFTSHEQVAPSRALIPSYVLQALETEGRFSGRSEWDGFFASQHTIAGSCLYDENQNMVGYVFAADDNSDLLAYLAESMSGFVMSAILVLLLTGLLTLLVTRRMLDPIERVSEAAKRFGEGDYSARVPVQGNNELTQLAIVFNEMANSFEATDASRRSFMGNIAHELRTPMTTIKGFLDGVLDGTIAPEDQKKYLEIASLETGRLARLTQNMLDISRLEAGEIMPQSKVFDIWQPIYLVFANTEQRILDKQLLVEGLDEVQSQLVVADEDYTHQVVMNLVDNAIKFTPEGGTIGIEVEERKTHTTITVFNSGDSLNPADMPQLFERFYKTDQSRNNKSGSGLGLHICKVLVGLMGGRIWAESEPGDFTKLRFTLPTAR